MKPFVEHAARLTGSAATLAAALAAASPIAVLSIAVLPVGSVHAQVPATAPAQDTSPARDPKDSKATVDAKDAPLPSVGSA